MFLHVKLAVFAVLIFDWSSATDNWDNPRAIIREYVQDNTKNVEKRVVCNAFTGCNPIRSMYHEKKSLKPEGEHTVDPDDLADESLSSVLDLSAEPAVEELNRQIMSEAKMYEAIQEANQELMRQKQANHWAKQGKRIRYG